MLCNIYQLDRTAVTDPYFVKWLFQTDEFIDDDPEKFDFDILVNNPSIGNFVYGYCLDDKLEGMVKIHDYGTFCSVSMLFVNSNSEDLGIGQKLLRFIIDKFGHKELALNVFTFNERAIHIYKKYGFLIASTFTCKDEHEAGLTISRFVGKEMYTMIRLLKEEVL